MPVSGVDIYPVGKKRFDLLDIAGPGGLVQRRPSNGRALLAPGGKKPDRKEQAGKFLQVHFPLHIHNKARTDRMVTDYFTAYSQAGFQYSQISNTVNRRDGGFRGQEREAIRRSGKQLGVRTEVPFLIA